jgi:alpha-glucosidase (family GH31 glycosyl hydrolase)
MTTRQLIRGLVFLTIGAATGPAAAESLGNYTSHSIDGSRLIVHAGTPAIGVQAYTWETIRVGLYPDGDTTDDVSPVVVLTPEDPLWQFLETDSTLIYGTPWVTVVIQKSPLRVRYTVSGQTVLADESGFFWDGAARGVRYVLDPNEHVWGGGERAASLDHRGERLNFYNAPDYCYGVGAQDLNIAIPFVISSRDYGLYFDDAYPGYLDAGQTQSGVMEYQVDGGRLSTFFIAGTHPVEILRSYTALTGRQPLPPRWALGYLQSRYGYQSEQEARNIVTQFRAQHIPLDAIILDLYWYGWGQMGDFDWENSHWPNPTDMMADFDSAGVKTILITEPYVLTTSSNWGPAQANDYLTPDSSGNPVVMGNFWAGAAGLLDVTLPAAADWFWGFYQNLISQGVGGWWCDLGEPELHPAQMVHHSGPAAAVHNLYSLLWAKRLYEGYENQFPEQRVFNLIRSGYAGMQRFSTFPWSGDVQRSFEGLQAQLPILLNMGLSGVAFQGCDIGGFNCGEQDPELYVRWMEFGAFSPMMRAHGTGVPTEPIYYDAPTREIVTNYIRLRYQLLPYNYTLAWENVATGIPLARPLIFIQSDATTANLDDEYLWGNSFLVAPVTQEDATSRPVYLPAGTWIDYWDETAYTGSQTLTANAPLDRLPLFVEAGSLIPMVPPIETTRDYATDTLIVQYYPDPAMPTSSYTMYEDDGETPDAYANQHYETLDLAANLSGSSADFDLLRVNHGYPGAPSQRRMYLQTHRVAAPPAAVQWNGNSLPMATSLPDLEAADSAFYFDGSSHRLHVAFHWASEETSVSVQGLELLSSPERPAAQPEQLELLPSFPNPFNSTTTISFTLPTAEHVSIKVFDMQGRLVRTVLAGLQMAGEHRVTLEAGSLASGIYFCRLTTAAVSRTRKLVLLR